MNREAMVEFVLSKVEGGGQLIVVGKMDSLNGVWKRVVDQCKAEVMQI